MNESNSEADRLLIISPCRNESDFMRQTIDSVIAQSKRPACWVIVDDGSTDQTPDILAEYAAQHDWIKIVQKPDRGHRAVGAGVIEAFYVGYEAIDPRDYTYICKLDLDLDLPTRYFETLIERMTNDPRIGTCSGKPYIRRGGKLVSERRGDEMSAGMTKLYRRTCFEDIGGFVREVMWDAIDCHKARQKGWRAISWDHPDLNFEHLRPMGSSQTSIWTGKRRHGFGQYYMGSDPLYYLATCLYRMVEPPYIFGGIAMAQGYFAALLKGEARQKDTDLIRFIRSYQRQALLKGRARAISDIEAQTADLRQPS